MEIELDKRIANVAVEKTDEDTAVEDFEAVKLLQEQRIPHERPTNQNRIQNLRTKRE